MDSDGYEILEIPEEGTLFSDPLELWDRYHTSNYVSDIGNHLTLFSVKTKKTRNDDDPLANEYRPVPTPTPTCGNVIEWLEEILNRRGKNFGFGVGLVPLEQLDPDVDSMDVDNVGGFLDGFHEDDDLDGWGNSPGGDADTSPPREEPVPSPSLPPPSPVKRVRKWSVRNPERVLELGQTPANQVVPLTGEILQINTEGVNLKGLHGTSFVFHNAEIDRQKCDVTWSSSSGFDASRTRLTGEGGGGGKETALWHEFKDLIAEAELDGQNWYGQQQEWGIEVISRIVRKVYLCDFPETFVLRRQRTEPIERRASPGANPGGFSPFSVLDEPWQSPAQKIAHDDDVPASPSVVEIFSAPSVATVPITARRRQTSSNPKIWHNASCTISKLEITKSSEIASLSLFPWRLSPVDGPLLVMGEREGRHLAGV